MRSSATCSPPGKWMAERKPGRVGRVVLPQSRLGQEAAETALRYYDRFPDLSSPPVWPSLDGGGCSFGSRKQRLISIEEDYLPHLERRADVEKRILKNVRARFRRSRPAAQGLGPRQRRAPFLAL